MKLKIFHIVQLSFLSVLVADIFNRLSFFLGGSNFGTISELFLKTVFAISIIVLALRFPVRAEVPVIAMYFIGAFLLWGGVQFFRGVSYARDYWDWKSLIVDYFFSILVPLAFVVGANYWMAVSLIRFLLKYVLPCSFLAIPIALNVDYEFYSRVVIAVGFLLLLIPYVPKKIGILILFVAVLSAGMDLSYRINVIRVASSLAIVIFVYYTAGFFCKKNNLFFASICLFVLPVLLLLLGYSGKFNVFEENPFDIEVATDNSSSDRVLNLSNDTRTFLYYEVFRSMDKRGSSLLLGEGGGSAYETEWFDDIVLNYRGRYGSEVGFLNVVLYSGFVGVFLYGVIILLASYFGICRSNNKLSKMIGLMTALHWPIFFIEDRPLLDMNNYLIWMSVGLCFSRSLRRLTDYRIRQQFYEAFGLVKKKEENQIWKTDSSLVRSQGV